MLRCETKLSFRDIAFVEPQTHWAWAVARRGPDRRSDANGPDWRLTGKRRTVSAAMDGTAHTFCKDRSIC